jgi:hypothetical protein
VLFERSQPGRGAGIRRFVADTLFHNRRMLAVLRPPGCRTRSASRAASSTSSSSSILVSPVVPVETD